VRNGWGVRYAAGAASCHPDGTSAAAAGRRVEDQR
jgi:hypothetical protein